MTLNSWAHHRCYLQYIGAANNKQSDQSVSQDVRTMIAATFGHMQPSLKNVASLFDVSERKLQRKLQREGMSFRDVLEESRKKAAHEYVKSGLSVTETAFMLGYLHPGNFTSAYRRWCGS